MLNNIDELIVPCCHPLYILNVFLAVMNERSKIMLQINLIR